MNSTNLRLDGPGQWRIRPARVADAPLAYATMGIARRRLPDGWYKEDSETYVASMFSRARTPIGRGSGFLAIGEGHGLTVGVGILRRPGTHPSNLGHDLDLNKPDLARVVHIEHLAVLTAWQGQGIGSALLAALEETAGEGILLATVHPDNKASLAMFARAGYTPVREGHEYGGVPRLIVRKDVDQEEAKAA